MTNKKPSILHVIDTTGPGGAETIFLDITQHLYLQGYENIAIIKGPGWVEEQLKKRGITYFVVKPKGGLSLNYYIALYKIIREHNVKLIQAHLLGSTLTSSLLSLFVRIPMVATLHGRVDVSPNERFIFLKNLIIKYGVNKLVAVSHDLATYIEGRKLFKKSEISIIYNGVDVERYGKTKSTQLREDLNIGKRALLIGSVGNIRPAKAYDVLVAAAKIVIDAKPNVHFVIAGHKKASLMAQLDAQINQLGIAANIHFVGFQDNSAEFLGQMDVFALSSSSEGFSIATIEAMASGLPAVVTKCGGPEEIIDHDKTGWLVEPNNPKVFAEAVLLLLSDKPLMKRLAAAGKTHTLATFSMLTMLAKYQDEYCKLLKISSGSR